MAINKRKLDKIINIILEKKAENVLLLDLRKISPITDFFIICTAQSPLHAQAICRDLDMKLKKINLSPHHIEGYQVGQWILLDYWDFIIHIFLADVREFYGLERLWGDAPQRRFV